MQTKICHFGLLFEDNFRKICYGNISLDASQIWNSEIRDRVNKSAANASKKKTEAKEFVLKYQ